MRHCVGNESHQKQGPRRASARWLPLRVWQWATALLCTLIPVRGSVTPSRPFILRFTVPKSGVDALPPSYLDMLERSMNYTRHQLSLVSPTQEIEVYYADDQSDWRVCREFYKAWASSNSGENATDILLGPVDTRFTEMVLRIANDTRKPVILWAPEIPWQRTGFIDLPPVWDHDQPPLEELAEGGYTTHVYPVGQATAVNVRPQTTSTTTVPPDHRCENFTASRCGYHDGFYVNCAQGRICCNSGWCRELPNATYGCSYGKQSFYTDVEVGLACGGSPVFEGEVPEGEVSEGDEIGRRLQLESDPRNDSVDVLGARDFLLEDGMTDFLDAAVYMGLTDTYPDLEGALNSSDILDVMAAYNDMAQAAQESFEDNSRVAVDLMYHGRCRDPQYLQAVVTDLERKWMEQALCGDSGDESNHTFIEPTNYTYAFDIRIPIDFILSGPMAALMEQDPVPNEFLFSVEYGDPQWLKMCAGGVYALDHLENRFGVTVQKMLSFYHPDDQADWARWLPLLQPAVLALCGSDRFIVDLIYVMRAVAFAPAALIVVTPDPVTVSFLVGGYNSLYVLRPVPWPAPEEFLQNDCTSESVCNASLVLSYHFNAVGEWLQGLSVRHHGAIPGRWDHFIDTLCCHKCGPIFTHLGMVTIGCTDGTRPHHRSDPLETPTATNTLVPLQYLDEGNAVEVASEYGDMQQYLEAKTYLVRNETMHNEHDFRFEFMPFMSMVYPMGSSTLRQSTVYPCPTGCHLTKDATGAGHIACFSCPPGTARSLYDHECLPCINTPNERLLVPHYTDTWGFAKCLPVEDGGVLRSADTEPVSAPGYYRFESWLYEKPGESPVCEGDGNPHEGFTFMLCDHPTFCLGNNTCSGHNNGVMCLYCEEGYTNMFNLRQSGTSEDRECVKCPSFEQVSLILGCLVLVYAGIIIWVSYFSVKDAKRTIALRGPIVRMFILHMQVLGSINDTDEGFSRQSPLVLDILLYRPFDLLALDCFLRKGQTIGDELVLVGGFWKISVGLYCFGIIFITFLNTFSLIYEVVMPAARVWGPIGIFTYFFGHFDKTRRTSKLDDGTQRRLGQHTYPVERHEHYTLEEGPGYYYTKRTIMIGLSTSRMVILRQCLVWTLIMYPIVLRNILKMITCSGSYGPLLRLRANLNVKCGQRAISGGWVLAYSAMALGWGFTIPFITWILTFRARGISQYSVETRLSIGLLMQGYTPGCGYWQVIMYARIAGLLFTNLFLHVQDRVMAKLCIILMSFCLNEYCQPFDHSQRFVMKRLDRMMHLAALLQISYSSSELVRFLDENKVTDGEHMVNDFARLLRMCVLLTFFWLLFQAGWSIIVVTFNPKWYSTEAKSEHSKLRFWHYIYLWIVDKVRGKNIVLVGWGPAGKYVDFENMSVYGKQAFMHGLQKALLVCLNSRELFPPAFLQVAFYEAFRRAVAGSDATVDVWRIRRHHKISLCHPARCLPFIQDHNSPSWGSDWSRSVGMGMTPSIVDHMSKYRFTLEYGPDPKGDFTRQAEYLKDVVHAHFPEKNPDRILSYLAITDCRGEDVHNEVHTVEKERFPLSVRWVAERQIGLEEIEAALADVSVDIQDFHPDCHRQFAGAEALISAYKSHHRKPVVRGGVIQEEDVERGDDDMLMPRNHHSNGAKPGLSNQDAARLHDLVTDDIRSMLGDEAAASMGGEDVYRATVDGLTTDISNKVEQRYEAIELSNLRDEMRRLQGVLQDLNESIEVKRHDPTHVVSSADLSQFLYQKPLSDRSITASAAASTDKLERNGCSLRSHGSLRSQRSLRTRSQRQRGTKHSMSTSYRLGLEYPDEEAAVDDDDDDALVTNASTLKFSALAPGESKQSVISESTLATHDNASSQRPPATAATVPSSTAGGTESLMNAAPKSSGEDAGTNGLGAAVSAAEAKRSRKAPEFWEATPDNADDTTLAKPALAGAVATAANAKVSGPVEGAHISPKEDSQAEDPVALAGERPAAPDEHADGSSEFSDWSIPEDAEEDQDQDESGGGRCSQQ